MRIGRTGWLVAAAVAVVGLAYAADAQKEKKEVTQPPAAAAAAPQASQDEMMAAWMKAATPGAEHAVLKNFEGKWTSHVTMTMDPTQPPQVSDGTSEGMLTMGGRFVHVLHHGTMMGQPFEGMMLLGYDNLAKKYTSVWVDTMGTEIVRYEGHFDAAKKAMTMIAHFTDPMSGKPTHTKGVTTFVDANTMTYDEYMPGPDGKEVRGLHIDFKRA